MILIWTSLVQEPNIGYYQTQTAPQQFQPANNPVVTSAEQGLFARVKEGIQQTRVMSVHRLSTTKLLTKQANTQLTAMYYFYEILEITRFQDSYSLVYMVTCVIMGH